MLCAILMALLFAVPAMALNDTDQAYMDGVKYGYALGAMNVLGQSDAAYEQAYNGRIASLNSWMDEKGWTEGHWAELIHATNYTLPRIFADPSDCYKKEA